jgi:hypothetical protein
LISPIVGKLFYAENSIAMRSRALATNLIHKSQFEVLGIFFWINQSSTDDIILESVLADEAIISLSNDFPVLSYAKEEIIIQ